MIDIVDGIVQIRLAGSCVGCMHSMMTLQAGVERMLKEQVPEIKATRSRSVLRPPRGGQAALASHGTS